MEYGVGETNIHFVEHGEGTPVLVLHGADDVCNCLLGFADEVADAERLLVVGHSAGAYYAQGIAARRTDQVAGLALVCPLLPMTRDVPEHRPLVG